MHYLLFYEVGEDYLARRAEFRDAHLEKAWAASERGELVLGGALADPVDGAVLLFKGESPAVAEEFAKADPYVTSGLVKRWHVREWTTVAGKSAQTPVHPKSSSSNGEEANEVSAMTGAKNAQGAIVRMWKAETSPEKFPRYQAHLTKNVFPELGKIPGYREAQLLRRVHGNAIEVTVLTFWDSMDAVHRFAGADAEKAVVEPEALAALTRFDEFVTHFEIVASA